MQEQAHVGEGSKPKTLKKDMAKVWASIEHTSQLEKRSWISTASERLMHLQMMTE